MNGFPASYVTDPIQEWKDRGCLKKIGKLFFQSAFSCYVEIIKHGKFIRKSPSRKFILAAFYRRLKGRGGSDRQFRGRGHPTKIKYFRTKYRTAWRSHFALPGKHLPLSLSFFLKQPHLILQVKTSPAWMSPTRFIRYLSNRGRNMSENRWDFFELNN